MASGVSVRLFPEDIAIEICKHCRQFSPGRSDQHREVEVGESALSELGLHLLLSVIQGAGSWAFAVTPGCTLLTPGVQLLGIRVWARTHPAPLGLHNEPPQSLRVSLFLSIHMYVSSKFFSSFVLVSCFK